ncbi:hypothetical protein ABPG72_021823 [Tetrahymena utriculariae]
MTTFIINLLKEEEKEQGLFVFFANKEQICFEKPIKQIQNETEKKIQDNPRDVISLMILAQIQYKYQTKEKNALEVLKKILQIDPLNIDARLELVQILLRKKNLPLKYTEVLINECFQLDENYWRIYYTKALRYLHQNQLLQSKLCISQSYEKFPKESWIRILYAQLLSEYKSTTKLSQCLIQEDILKTKLDYESILRIAYLYGNLDNQDMSEKYLHKAIQLNSNSSKANNNLGYLYRFFKNDDDSCIKYCNKALEIDNNNEDSYYNLSASYSRKQDYKKSIDLLKKCIAINKNYQYAYQELVYITYQHLKQLDLAYYFVQKLVKKFPSNQYGCYFLSYIQDFDIQIQNKHLKRDLELTEIIEQKLISDILLRGSKYGFVSLKNLNNLLNTKYNIDF